MWMLRPVAVIIAFAIVLFFCYHIVIPPPQPDIIHPSIRELYRSQIAQRKSQLTHVPDNNVYSILYNVLVPEVFCSNLVRIGRVTDGGKWVCNPNEMFKLPECTIYSLGINNDPSFDEDFQRYLKNKCKLRSFDKGAQGKGTLKRIEDSNGVFMKALIAGTTNHSNNQYTFRDLLTKFEDDRIDILKIDIEGAEFAISDELISVPMCQILIEIHGKTAKKTLELMQKLSQNGYYLFSYEINGAHLNLSEYSFLHEKCFKDYSVDIVYGKYLS